MTRKNIYSIPVADDQFSTRCGGSNNEDGEGESCVQIARVNDHGFAFRDTKQPGVELRFTTGELAAAGITIADI